MFRERTKVCFSWWNVKKLHYTQKWVFLFWDWFFTCEVGIQGTNSIRIRSVLTLAYFHLKWFWSVDFSEVSQFWMEVQVDVSSALGFIMYPLSASILLLAEQEHRHLQNGSHCNELNLWPPLATFPDSLAVCCTSFTNKVIFEQPSVPFHKVC